MGENPTAGSVLVVDDTEVNIDLLVEAFGDIYDISVAMDGETALESVSEELPDLILLDIMMPGIDGYEVLERIRQDHSPNALPIIMATALEQSKDIVRALELGANDYVTKPFDLPVVLARVRAQLSAKKAREDLAAAHKKMKKDLEAAARIQQTLLPSSDHQIAGAEFSWRYLPCDELAGDTLNIVPLDEHRVALYVVDVSGHGVPSALLSVTLSRVMSGSGPGSSILWTRDSASGADRVATPLEVAYELAERFPHNSETGQYFTMVYAVLDLDKQEMSFVSAGHTPLIHLRRGEAPLSFSATGPPIGLFPATLLPPKFDEQTVQLESGDRFYFYSDGIPEAENAQDEEYGNRRLSDELQMLFHHPLGESLDSVLEKVQRWVGRNGHNDDVSILAVEVG